MKKSNTGFSVIEILIGILIFTMGLTGIYALILSTMNMNEYSKNSIIATNLARESLENVRNLRDNNYKHLYKWNKLPGGDAANLIATGVYYKIEDNFDSLSPDVISFQPIANFQEGKTHLDDGMDGYRLCLDSQNRYTYNCVNNKKTYFYRYVKFDDVTFMSGSELVVMPESLKMTSKVIWYKKGYHEIQLDTILTDYLRQ